jgi:hypothetical protein
VFSIMATVPDFKDWLGDVRRTGQKAVRGAVDIAGKGLKNDFRQQLDRAGYKPKLGNMFGQRTFPAAATGSFRAASAMAPRGGNAAKYLQTFIDGATISARGGRHLCIPTEYNPRRTMESGPAVKPADLMRVTATKGHWRGAQAWIAPSRKQPGVLIWWGRVAFTTPAGPVAKGKRALRSIRTIGGSRLRVKLDKDSGAVPLFVLVPIVRIKKIIDAEGTAQKWADAIPDLIERALPGAI